MLDLEKKGITCISRLRVDDPRYAHFLAKNNSTVFHAGAWLTMIGQANGLEPVCYCYLEDDEIQWALAGFLFDWKLGKIFFSSLYDSGYLGPAQKIHEFVPSLLEQFKNDNVVSLRIMKTFSAPLELGPDFQKTEASQHIIDLTGVTEEKLWNEIYRNRVRKAIRKAERGGVRVIPIETMEHIHQLLRLNQETIKRRNAFYAFNSKTVEGLFTHYLSCGKGAGWLVLKDELPIAGLLNIYSEETSHGLISGSLEEYLHLPSNDLLIHEGIKDAIRKGKHHFDFMCALAGDDQIKSFKKKFGAWEYPACFYEMDLAPIRAKIWFFLWKMLHTSFGAKLARWIH